MKKRRIFYSNVEKIRFYYHVSNFAINQPMLLVISDLGLYLCIFCSFRLGCGATKKTAGPTWPLENTGAISDGRGLGREVYNFSLD